MPELRIVDDDLWQAVKARQVEFANVFEATRIGVREARAKRFNMTRRPVFLLSGLLTCGCCRGKYGIIMNDRYGCLNRHRRGSCSNPRTIRRAVIEQRVLFGWTKKLVSTEAVAEAVRAYHEQMNRQKQARRAQMDGDRQALTKISGLQRDYGRDRGWHVPADDEGADGRAGAAEGGNRGAPARRATRLSDISSETDLAA